MDASVDDVVEILKAGKPARRGCSLLIGAGCSVTAGIPLAAGFVDIIKTRFPKHYAGVEPKTYPMCMARLGPGPGRDLIAEFVDQAKIN